MPVVACAARPPPLSYQPPDYLRNNTAIYTAKGVEVVPIVDGCQTEGKIAFHDSCVDKPTGGMQLQVPNLGPRDQGSPQPLAACGSKLCRHSKP